MWNKYGQYSTVNIRKKELTRVNIRYIKEWMLCVCVWVWVDNQQISIRKLSIPTTYV